MSSKRLIDALPGVSMSVKDVTTTLSHMWDTGDSDETHRMDFRASQMNVILHFGLETTVEEAQRQFDVAIEFAQKYPCRIVILCPAKETSGEFEFEGKLFSQCYIGRNMRDLCCCEALILGYSPEQSDFLESQVSIWLESDLPIYHWLHRVPAARIEKHYLGFLKRCRKVLFDGAIEGDAYDDIEWPDPERVSDLAHARTLPLRQHLGQFLSRFPPEELVDGLESLKFEYNPGMRRMAHQMMRWHKAALAKCFPKEADLDAVVFSFESGGEDDSEYCLDILWQYKDGNRHVEMRYNRSRKSGMIRTSLPSGSFEHPIHVEPLNPAAALGEAMFFG